MAKKRTGKKRKKKASSKRQPLRNELKRAIVGLSILLLLVILAGAVTYYLILRRPPQPPSPVRPTPPKRVEETLTTIEPDGHTPPAHTVYTPPTYEVFPKEKIILPEPSPETAPPAGELPKLPRIAIIIDDLGYQKRLAYKFLELDAVLTFSLLPHSPFQERIAGSAHEKGFEIMLHLPMEPHEYPAVDAGPGTLLMSMTPDELIEQLTRDLDAVPHIKGVNNHMGSRMTENSTRMYQIFTTLKKRGLYFIDSLTTSESLSQPSARLFRVPFGQRDVFIDHIQEPEFIRGQIALLIRIARKHGQAIGIAHPHLVTYEVLREMLPEIENGVELVPASELVEIVS